MRKLIVLVVVSALLYGGYWFVGRSQIEARLTEALAEVNDGPYGLSYDTLQTRGFPSRFDTTITNLAFTDFTTGTAWAADVFQLLALSYRPNEVIAIFPASQSMRLSGVTYQIETADMRASGRVRPSATLAFDNATITMDNPRITPDGGETLEMASVLAAMRLTPETTQTYDLYLEARTIALPDSWRRLIDPGRLQPEFLQNLRIDTDLFLTAPIELNGNGTTAPEVETLGIQEIALTWGEMSASAIGTLTPDASGVLTGSITVSARNWQQGLDLAVANGAVNADRRLLVTEILNNLDETPDFPDTLTVTVTFAEGQMAVGGFGLGQAPRIR